MHTCGCMGAKHDRMIDGKKAWLKIDCTVYPWELCSLYTFLLLISLANS